MSSVTELLNQQKQSIDVLKKIRENYRKDTKDRKAEPNYYEKKLKALEEWWVVFDANNQKLTPHSDEYKHQPYFKEKTFEATRELYLKHRTKLQDDQEALKQSVEDSSKESDGSAEAGTSVQLIAMNLMDDESDAENDHNNDEDNHTVSVSEVPVEAKVLFFQHKELKLALNQIENLSVSESKGLACAQLENVKLLWAEFRLAFRNVSISENSESCDKINFGAIQKQYLSAFGKLSEMSSGKASQNVQLPKLQLPMFDGDPDNWMTFKDLFDRIVHLNPSLPEGIKIQYLKTHITGKALGSVRHLPTTEASYLKCYETLCNKYDNTRALVSRLIDQLLDLEIQKSESSSGLKLIHDKTVECLMSIESVGTSVNNWDVLLIQVLMRKLDKKTIIDYESRLENVKENQTLKSFLKYLENRYLALMSAESKTRSYTVNEKSEKNQKFEKKVEKSVNCLYCEKEHDGGVYKCTEFEKIDAQKRSEWAKEKKVCFNCLQKHKFGECKSKFNCKKCNKRHNTLLHFSTNTEMKSQTCDVKKTSLIAAAAGEKSEVEQVNKVSTNEPHNNLLATAWVNVASKNGEMFLLKAVVDQGSQSPIITENALQLLKLNGKRVHAGIDGVEGKKSTANKIVSLSIKPRFSSEYTLECEALVMKKITTLSVFKGDLSQYDHLQNLKLADPTVNDDKEIDLLLGVAEFGRIVNNGLVKGADDAPIAMNSELGWLIMGPQRDNDKKTTIKITSLILNSEIENKIDKFFASETMGSVDGDCSQLSDEEKYCEENYLKTTRRNEEGRFVVSYPFRNKSHVELGESKRTALATLFQLEKRFLKNSNLKKEYTIAMHDDIARGYMVLVENPPRDAYYIPHHAVFKDSTTTKLRTVYNASQKTSNGLSLNEQLAIGKLMQPSMFSLMISWRMHKIVIIADLEKMYKQIRIEEIQQKLQMILWRDSSDENIKTYKLTTVTFGVAPSPFLAIRTLREIASVVENEFPNAAQSIRDCFYVDDHVGGVDTVEQAVELYNQLKTVFDRFGFNLRKFVSNSSEFLNKIPNSEKEEVNSVKKVLGVTWQPKTDELTFKIPFELESKPKTKRQLLSEIATLYDPMGYLAPIVVKAKLIMQEVWMLSNKVKNESKYGWDDQLPAYIIDEWMKFKTRSTALNSIKIPRWLKTNAIVSVQIHGFADACDRAYAANVYVRVVNENNEISSNLLVAKTKTTANKSIVSSKKLYEAKFMKKSETTNELNTIPKFELCGANLLVNLVKSVFKSMNLNIEKTYLWSDSKIVLAWIANDPNKYKKFVSTRVKNIQTLESVTWCHVPGKLNPVDCASRGIYADELKEHSLWWHGPPMLKQHENYETTYGKNEFNTNNEIRNVVLLATEQNESIIPCASSFYKLKKTFAYVLRFAFNCKPKKRRNAPRKVGGLTVAEVKNSETVIIKLLQAEHFATEIALLNKSENLSKSNKLSKLCVFIDHDGILRVGGRLKNANIPFDMRHQKLIPKKSEVTDLIIGETHLLGLHSGPKLTESLLRRQYWVEGGARSIKRIIRRCVECSIHKPRTMAQLMGDLPKERVNASDKPFVKTAIDFAGPIKVKTNKLRAAKIVKGYICIFVCMVTRAIHLEPVGDLTAVAFIAALRRFAARRGTITDIFSDNATNFVGANSILSELSEDERDQFDATLKEESNKMLIQWHFSPPASPHFNGLAEAAVKSSKFHLKRVIGDSALTFEELATLLCQIEYVLNSRPICELSDDPNEIGALTPAHFLNVANGEQIPDEELLETKISMLSHWQKVQQKFQNFWFRWKQDYLHQLQVRSKWHKEEPNVQIGKLVLLKDENLPSTKWPMGRVVETHPGKDGLIRVVSVKTKNNILKRSVTKIAPLPLDIDDKERADVQAIQRPTACAKRSASVKFPIIALLALVLTLTTIESAPVNGISRSGRHRREFWLQAHYFDELRSKDIEIQKSINSLQSTSDEYKIKFSEQMSIIQSAKMDIKIYIGINLSVNVLIHIFVYLFNKRRGQQNKKEKRNGKKQREISVEMERKRVRIAQESHMTKPLPTPRLAISRAVSMPSIDSEYDT